MNQSLIDRDGGLKQYLNRRRVLHNGYGFNDFVSLLQSKKNSSEIALVFGKDYRTIQHWIKKAGWIKKYGGRYAYYVKDDTI